MSNIIAASCSLKNAHGMPLSKNHIPQYHNNIWYNIIYTTAPHQVSSLLLKKPRSLSATVLQSVMNQSSCWIYSQPYIPLELKKSHYHQLHPLEAYQQARKAAVNSVKYYCNHYSIQLMHRGIIIQTYCSTVYSA